MENRADFSMIPLRQTLPISGKSPGGHSAARPLPAIHRPRGNTGLARDPSSHFIVGRKNGRPLDRAGGLIQQVLISTGPYFNKSLTTPEALAKSIWPG
jgi:hypothetical protein